MFEKSLLRRQAVIYGSFLNPNPNHPSFFGVWSLAREQDDYSKTGARNYHVMKMTRTTSIDRDEDEDESDSRH